MPLTGQVLPVVSDFIRLYTIKSVTASRGQPCCAVIDVPHSVTVTTIRPHREIFQRPLNLRYYGTCFELSNFSKQTPG